MSDNVYGENRTIIVRTSGFIVVFPISMEHIAKTNVYVKYTLHPKYIPFSLRPNNSRISSHKSRANQLYLNWKSFYCHSITESF